MRRRWGPLVIHLAEVLPPAHPVTFPSADHLFLQTKSHLCSVFRDLGEGTLYSPRPSVFLFDTTSNKLSEDDTRLRMSDGERTALRVLLDLQWSACKKKYVEAGRPFGKGRGMDIWIQFDQRTTVN